MGGGLVPLELSAEVSGVCCVLDIGGPEIGGPLMGFELGSVSIIFLPLDTLSTVKQTAIIKIKPPIAIPPTICGENLTESSVFLVN